MPTRLAVGTDLERVLLTAEEFLEWLDPEHPADLIDGEICMHSPVSVRHADLLNFLDGVLRFYVDRHRLGFLYREVVAVRLNSRNVFQPDLAYYRADRAGQIRKNHVAGAPDLVVEVLSPRTAGRDIGQKFAQCELHGVTEYWVLDPETLAHHYLPARRRAAGGVRRGSGQDRVARGARFPRHARVARPECAAAAHRITCPNRRVTRTPAAPGAWPKSPASSCLPPCLRRSSSRP